MTDTKRAGLSYRDAGVDIDAGDALVERIKGHVRRTQQLLVRQTSRSPDQSSSTAATPPITPAPSLPS